MADINGNKTGGRQPGTPNKRNQELQELAKSLGCDPAKILMLTAIGDSKALAIKQVDDKGNEVLIEPDIDFEKRIDAAKDLMPYMYGKRKPVDTEGNDGADPISELMNAFRNS